MALISGKQVAIDEMEIKNYVSVLRHMHCSANKNIYLRRMNLLTNLSEIISVQAVGDCELVVYVVVARC